MNSKTLIIAAIALVLIILGAVVFFQGTTAKEENVTAYDVPLKSADFNYFTIDTPENSNFTIKNSLNETSKGMVYWANTGNFSKEVQGITINKNLTDQLIHDKMTLLTKENGTRVYESNGIYQVVKTINDTDIILTGANLNVLNEMIATVKIKDTSNITSPQPVEKTPIEHVVDSNKKPKKDDTPKKSSDNGRKKTQGQIYIGGGIIKTGSGLNDKTNAKIYIDGGHPGESVIVRIKYYRDGNSLNTGNMVTATIHDDGYVHINSADAYKYYPDKAYIELYDLDGKLQMTQTVTLNPDSSTQYF